MEFGDPRRVDVDDNPIKEPQWWAWDKSHSIARLCSAA
ncbi:Hypothetical protein MIP_03809 [Mycobacterium intracellulare subsp. intracellulare MTCC 9506]|uniref:Uncharacterized protein n=1 Tax=Mycobacterium indicus pranii (strain DSM 45239 / MTCC 9506) TaxID=1232724 RepID=J9WH35_MYCIP|nr:hypothetical protein OCQ_26530 [Mycobacterium paraintracellulare]AFS14616.1 Hypothetical protein MIP_03809 [Mycobacterium intracellulare subsp. intracellulare MTCC 9506]